MKTSLDQHGEIVEGIASGSGNRPAMSQIWIDGREAMPPGAMLEQPEVEQGAAGAWWLFVLTGGAWLGISVLVFEWVV
jgi:hypothetical protein